MLPPFQSAIFQSAIPMRRKRRGDDSSVSGFTLLEVCLAIFIGLLIIVAAVPSLSGLLDGQKGNETLNLFNGLVQEARTRSIEERRPYVLLWTKEGVVMQADGASAGEEEARTLTLEDGDSLVLELPAALKKAPEPIWTFWPSGACEPAKVVFRGQEGAWTAVYNPFTASAEVTHE
jgi:hypothetical protein